MKPLLLAGPFFVAAVLALALTPLSMRLAALLGAVDLPGERKVHMTPIPRLGGVAVIAAFVLVCLAVMWNLVPVPRPLEGAMVHSLCLGLLPVFAISLLDDARSQRALTRLAAQSLGAIVVIANGFVLNPSLQLFGSRIEIGLLAYPLSFLWILGVTNAFNLIDGLDGLSAGLALISSLSLAGVFVLADRIDIAVIPIALAGALVGFLRYNLHPASVFMGDSGACSIGFLLACLCLTSGTMLSAGLAVLVPVLIVGVPVADTLLSIVRRVLGRLDATSGRGIMDADRGHIHHKLLALGLNQRRAVLLLHGVALAGAAMALGSLFLSAAGTALFLVALLGAGFVGVSRLGYEELAVIRRGTILRLYDSPVLKAGFFAVFVDLLMAVLSLYLAIGFKWDDWELQQHRGLALELGSLMPALVFFIFQLFGLNRGRWRHASLEDLLRPTAAVLLTGAAAVGISALAVESHAPPSFFVVFTLILLFLTNASRSSYRLLDYWRSRSSKPGVPVLLYGAGRRGSMALRELSTSADASRRAIGFVDDDPEKAGLTLNGVPVVGSFADLDGLIQRYEARAVVVTSPRIPAGVVARVEDVCSQKGVSFLSFRMSFDETRSASRDRRDVEMASSPGPRPMRVGGNAAI